MSLMQRLLQRPHAVIAFALVATLMGIMGFLNMPTNLRSEERV